MKDTIEREIIINVSISEVWDALVDYRKFGEWFGVKIDGPFEVGKLCVGAMTIPGYEHLKWQAKIVSMEEEKLFSYEWPPYVDSIEMDFTKEPWLLVEFKLIEIPEGTLLKVKESGFSRLSTILRDDARRGNEKGWEIQLKNIQKYVSEIK